MWRRLVLGVALSGLASACDEQVYVQVSPPILTLNSEEIGFGEIPIHNEVEKRLTIVNAGGEPLEVSGVEITGAGAAAFKASPEHLSVVANGEAQLLVQFTPVAVIDYVAALELSSNASNAKVKSVPLSGSGVDDFQCGPCNTPPQAGCLTEYNRVTYDPQGECVNGECRYRAIVESCEHGCDPVSRGCVGVTYDAGLPDSAAHPDGAAPADSAGPVDAARDAFESDAGAGCIDEGVSTQLDQLSGGPYQNCAGGAIPYTQIQANTEMWSGCCGYLVRECMVEGYSTLNRVYCDADAEAWCHPDDTGMCQN